MWMMMKISIAPLIITSIMWAINKSISMKKNKNEFSMSPFECGFSTKTKESHPFSLQFFMVTMMFILFDIEISILILMIPAMKVYTLKSWLKVTSIFMLIMMISLMYEWNMNSMKWSK